MASTVIAILLAGVVIFWKAPFSFALIPIVQTLRRYRRRIVLVFLLLAVIAAPTHTSSSSRQPANFSGEKPVHKCVES